MAELKSHGLMGLPHYRNSRVSMELYEPIYQNFFTVQLTLPPGVAKDQQDTNLILEGVTKVSGIDTNKLPDSPVTQSYKFAQRSFAGAKPSETTVDLTLDMEVNLQYDAQGNPTNYTIKTLRKWTDLIFDPLTGRSGLKRDYVAPNMTVTVQDRAGNPFWGWIFYNVFPTNKLPAPDLNYDATDLMKISGFRLRADIWDEVML